MNEYSLPKYHRSFKPRGERRSPLALLTSALPVLAKSLLVVVISIIVLRSSG